MSHERQSEYIYRPAWWVPGGHAHTIWGKLFRPRSLVKTRLERIETPDGDFIDLHRLDAREGAPRLVVLHGLEGTIRSHYLGGLLARAAERGWAADVLLFRSCGPELNRTPRFYHSGETGDLAFVVEQIRREGPAASLVFVGVSLGGNVLLKWLGEKGDALPPTVRGAAVLSVPYDLERGSRHISSGFARLYEAHFLRTLRRKAREKLRRFPGLFDARALAGGRTLYAFDDVVTAPVHGFRDAHEYYSRSSSLGWLRHIRVPTLLLSAEDDPFLPVAVLSDVRNAAAGNPYLHLEFVHRGGHVGFVSGRLPWRPFYYGEWRAIDFLARRLEATDAREAVGA